MDSTHYLAQRCHAALPERVRSYLNQRGISDRIIDDFLLGWNGWRITIPVFGRDGKLSTFRLAKDPDDTSNTPKMLSASGSKVELYGWETLLAQPQAVVICEGEFDRLVLESHEINAVTSTGGAATFKPEWVEAFPPSVEVYICFDNDQAGRLGACKVAELIPHARLVELPAEVGEGGDVTDFFFRLGRTRDDFLALLSAATLLARPEPAVRNTNSRALPSTGMHSELERLKQLVPIDQLIARFLPLCRTARHCVGRCPFHDDTHPSFVVYPQSHSFYCFGCQAHGDALDFLMRYQNLTFPEAIQVLRNLAP